MIFVTVGSLHVPFDRLLRELEQIPPGEDLVVQRGSSTIELPHATCVDFLPFEALVEYVREARVVVSHAGVGSVLVALANGKHPLVVPRLPQFGEVVDDHQLQFGRRLEQAHMATLVEDPAQLPEELARHAGYPSAAFGASNRLVEDLRAYLIARVGPPRRQGSPQNQRRT